MGERSFAEDVKQLGYGAGQILHGEGILAITKALLQSGVSYVGGYPGAPDLAPARRAGRRQRVAPASRWASTSSCPGSEAAAAALLGASINYPMRGAVTWKSVVGTNVASDALSHVASAGVHGRRAHRHRRGLRRRRVHPAGAHALGGAQVVDAAARSAQQPAVVRALRRGGLRPLRGVQRAGVLLDPHPRLPHARHARAARTTCGPPSACGRRSARPSFSLERINLPPFTYAMEAQKFERAAARRPPLHRRARPQRAPCRGDGGAPRHRDAGRALEHDGARARTCSAWPTSTAARPVPLLVLNALHPLVPEELIAFLRGKTRVLVVEEGMPNYIERELKALAHDARLDVEIHGKDLLSPHGEYVPALVIGGLAQVPRRGAVRRATVGRPRSRTATPRSSATRRACGRRCPQPIAKRPPSFCTGCPERPVFSAMKILRRRTPAIGDTHVSADIGCNTFSHAGAVQRRQLGARLRHGAGLVERGGAALRQARDRR